MNQDLVSITDHASIVSATSIKLICVWFSLPHFILDSISTMDLVHVLRNFEFNLMTLKVSEVIVFFSQKLMNPDIVPKEFNLSLPEGG